MWPRFNCATPCVVAERMPSMIGTIAVGDGYLFDAAAFIAAVLVVVVLGAAVILDAILVTCHVVCTAVGIARGSQVSARSFLRMLPAMCLPSSRRDGQPF